MRRKPKNKNHNFGRMAVLTRTFSKDDTTIWSYKLFGITEINNNKKTSYRIDKLLKRYNEALSKKTKLTLKENGNVIKKTISEITTK